MQVGRPDYTVQDVSDMKRPWEMYQDGRKRHNDDDSETEWDADFSFASERPRKEKGKQEMDFDFIIRKSLQDDSDETDAMLTLQTIALRDVEARGNDSFGRKSRSMSLHVARKSVAMERDASMRKSLAQAVSRRSFFAGSTMMDNPQTSEVLEGGESEVEFANG